MALKSILNEMKRGIPASEVSKQSCCCRASMPPEPLLDGNQRMESSDGAACASVCCCSGTTKEVVKTPEQSGQLTSTVSLKHPGPRDKMVPCVIKRDKATATYQLCLCVEPPAAVMEGEFLLAARKIRTATSTNYIISSNAEDISGGSSSYVGMLRSNLFGTKFKIYDIQPPLYSGSAIPNSNRSARRMSSNKVSPSLRSGRFNVAQIEYQLNPFDKSPRRMQCTLNSIPESAMDPNGSAPTRTEVSSFDVDDSTPFSELLPPPRKSKIAVADCSAADFELVTGGIVSKDGPLVLKSKEPRWSERIQCWILNFRGRVTVASVKNFQLVAQLPPSAQTGDYNTVLLQFGKIGKDMFTMDYRYPLSAFQAFAICLSSFGNKLRLSVPESALKCCH